MNKTLKVFLIIVNLIMLAVATSWYLDKKEKEPLIVIFGQVATLLGLIFEKKVSEINTNKIRNNSDVDIDVLSGDNATTSDVDNSKVRVKTKK